MKRVGHAHLDWRYGDVDEAVPRASLVSRLAWVAEVVPLVVVMVVVVVGVQEL